MDRLNKRSFMPHSRLSLISRCAREIWEARRDVWECFMKKWRVDTFKGSQAPCIFYLHHRGLLHSEVKCLRCVTTITLSFTEHSTHFNVDVALLHILASCRPRKMKLIKVDRDINIVLCWRSWLPGRSWVAANAWTESGHEYLSVGSGRTTSRWWALNMLWRGPVLTLSSA